MDQRPKIRIGDVGTIYAVPVYDGKPPVNFDPSSADTKQMRLSMPQADGSRRTITRTAQAAQVLVVNQANPLGVMTWCLTYTVVADDVVADMHLGEGNVELQGYIAYADGRKWSSSITGYDQDGDLMQVGGNL